MTILLVLPLATLAEWKMASVPIKTRFADAVTPDNVLPEYPRPQMVRMAGEELAGYFHAKIRRFSMQIKCDKCSAVSESIMPETYTEGDIEFTFFRCPECGAVYPVCATDSALRADIAEYTRMRNLIRMKPVMETTRNLWWSFRRKLSSRSLTTSTASKSRSTTRSITRLPERTCSTCSISGMYQRTRLTATFRYGSGWTRPRWISVPVKPVATSWDTYYPNAVRGQNLHNIALEGMKNVRIMENKQNLQIDPSKINTSGALDISLVNNKGQVSKLSDLKGKVVLLDFHAFAANESTARIMKLREIYNKYHAQGLEIYQVSVDPNEHFWKQQTAALPWVCVRDPQGIESGLMQTFNIQDIPTFFIVGRDNLLHKRDAQIKDLDAEIQSLL